MCMADHDLEKHAADFALSRLAVLKAAGPPEFKEILIREAELRRALGEFHIKASRKAIRAAQSAARAGRPLRSILAAVRKAYKDAFDDAAIKAITSQVSHFYALGKRAAWRRALGASKVPLQIDPPLPPAELPGVEKAATPLEIAPTFDLQDVNAINRLNRHQVFWVGDHYDKNLSRRIAWTARDVIVRQGLTGEDAAKELGEALERELDVVPADYVRPDAAGPVPPGWQGTAATYHDGLATNAATTARTAGSIDAFRRVGVRQIEILNPSDERTCDRCNTMNRKRFPLRVASGQMDAILGATTPGGVRSAQPWLKVSQFKGLGIPRGAGTRGTRTLTENNMILPPYHFHCRCVAEIVPGPVVNPDQPKVRTRPAPRPKIPKRRNAPVPATVPRTST